MLGVGKTALAVKRQAEGYAQFIGTTRGVERMQELEQLSIEPVLIEFAGRQLRHQDNLKELKEKVSGAHVLVSFPPDKLADAELSVLASEAAAIVYVSSTGVYGRLSGKIDETSALSADSPSAMARLASEAVWLQAGAVVLRAAGLYDAYNGLHIRLQSGTYRIPGDGSNYVSRIHLDDLAAIVLAAFENAKPGALYVVADSRPSTHLEVAQWLCEQLKLPLPGFVPLDMVHETLQGNRQIIAQKILNDLNVKLKYPSFVEGYESILLKQSAK